MLAYSSFSTKPVNLKSFAKFKFYQLQIISMGIQFIYIYLCRSNHDMKSVWPSCPKSRYTSKSTYDQIAFFTCLTPGQWPTKCRLVLIWTFRTVFKWNISQVTWFFVSFGKTPLKTQSTNVGNFIETLICCGNPALSEVIRSPWRLW